MDEARFMEGLMGMMGRDEEETPSTYTTEEIKALGARYLEKNDFELGQLVTWKEGMDNCKYPEPGKPAVIVDMEPGCRSGKGEDDSMGGNHSYEPQNIRVGIVQGRTGRFEAYWVDANRFQPYVEG